jgi:twitching motility protein PilT
MADPDLHLIDRYLDVLWQYQASDLLVTADSPPLLRIDGVLRVLDGETPFSPADTDQIVMSVLGAELGAVFRAEKEVDFSFAWRDHARFRANAFHQRGAAALALRLIPIDIPTFDDIGLPVAVDEMLKRLQGLVLVTGPTGSGKSTTLASMIDRINERRACHIITIEDPIEYIHQHKRSAVEQREIGIDTLSFDRALRSVLREDPDVVLVGEMRDPETIAAALTIAETGHLVFATLHTNDAAQAVDRIVDVFSAERQQQIRVQLAGSLTAILSQRLLRRVGGGRVAAFEILVATPAARNLIRDAKSQQLRNVISTGAQHGMQTIEASLSALLAQGVVEHEDALAVSLYPNELNTSAR